jgi:uncharacterized protein
MKFIFSLFFSVLFATSFAQLQNKSITIGTIETVHSEILNEERNVLIYVPQNFGDIYAKQAYPVVYVMDGEAHFNSVVGIVEQLSQINGNRILPQMIVVGIANTNRMRDLSPSQLSKSSSLDSATLASTGGGDSFTAFLEKELIPHIDSLYTTAPYRIVIGHSLGGLMVVDELLNHAKLFNSYISIDPSMWWDNQKLLKQAEKDLSIKNFEGETLYLAIANTMKANMDTLSVRRDTTEDSEHIRSILELTDVLKKNSNNNLSYKWKYYNDDDHGSIPLIAAYDGLRFIFGFTKFSMPEEYKNNASAIFLALEKHYKKVSKQMGYTILPSETILNSYGYNFLEKNELENAYKFFKFNVDCYPNSFNVYDSIGDYYAAAGNKKMAIESYTKALTIYDYQGTKEKLERLKN